MTLRTAFWSAYVVVIVILLYWLYGQRPAFGQTQCGDVLDFAAWRTSDDGWTWKPLGEMADGSTVFMLREATGLWEIVTVKENRACLVQAGDPGTEASMGVGGHPTRNDQARWPPW